MHAPPRSALGVASWLPGLLPTACLPARDFALSVIICAGGCVCPSCRLQTASYAWRGGPQGEWHDGKHLRRDFVHALSDRYDVRFANVAVQADDDDEFKNGSRPLVTHPNHTGATYSHEQLMRFKYVLSLEGNDVATDLKWRMAQNSVVVMPRPTKETWLMEGCASYHPAHVAGPAPVPQPELRLVYI